MRDNRKFILLIDDSTDLQDLLKMVFEAKGYRVDCTSNGQEALSLLQVTTHMPVMDGFEFRSLQNQDRRYKHIPVVVMTGDTEDDLEGRMKNPDVIMRKPFQLNSMLNCITPFMTSPNLH